MARAERVLARGVASGARLRTTTPSLAVARADGATIVDVDGHEYVDHVLGLGPIVLGHRPPAVVAAVGRSLERGILFGAQHEAEADLCERLVAAVPGAEMTALVSTGSEAVHLAVRIARATTGRRRVIKFDGHYHGWIDPLFVNAPWAQPVASAPTGATHAVAGERASDEITVTRWGSLDELERAFEEGPPPAAVIAEPIPCNFGTVEPAHAYAAGVRELCRRHGALLIYDEVLTGFRLALGGAQERLGVTPDLTVCSKAIASGFPLAAVLGSAEAMASIVSGPVRPAGTFNGTPASVAAAVATVGELAERRSEIYPRLDRLGAELADGIRAAAATAGAPLTVNQVGSVVQLFWGVDGPVDSYAMARTDERQRVAELAGRLLARGVHVAERGLLLLCDAHRDEHLERTVSAFASALEEMRDHTMRGVTR